MTKLKRIMFLQEITPKDVANKLGVTVPAVYRWMAGDRVPRMPRLRELADFLGCSVNDVID